MPDRPSDGASEPRSGALIARVRVRVTRGERELHGEGTLLADLLEVRVVVERQSVRALYERLSGMTWTPPRLVLHAPGGAVIEADGGADLGPIASEIFRRAGALPELTRALRSFGSSRSTTNEAMHDALFAPLLAARRAAESATDAMSRVDAFDAAALREAVERSIAEIAAVRHPASAPHRRAIEATLLDAADPLFASLTQLAATATLVREADGAERFIAWRAWALAARRVFESADRAWADASRELAHSPFAGFDARPSVGR